MTFSASGAAAGEGASAASASFFAAFFAAFFGFSYVPAAISLARFRTASPCGAYAVIIATTCSSRTFWPAAASAMRPGRVRPCISLTSELSASSLATVSGVASNSTDESLPSLKPRGREMTRKREEAFLPRSPVLFCFVLVVVVFLVVAVAGGGENGKEKEFFVVVV